MRKEMTERTGFGRLGRTLVAAGVSAALVVGASGAALAEGGESGGEWREYDCTPGLLGTGIACSNTGDDLFEGGPLDGDSELANALRGVLGGGGSR